ncbi:MAG: hypothetical protein IPP66_03260 [Anaerolineales bacterium]|nr:hypothetical protein [Anaerolineales bacterium]
MSFTSTAPVKLQSTSVLDNFNRANGAPGTNWSGSTSGFSVVSNRLDIGSGGQIFWGTQFGTDQDAYTTFSTIDPAGTQQAILLKSQSKTSWNNGVIGVLYDAINKRVQVFSYSSVQGWIQHGTNISLTMSNGDQLGARARANGTIDIYHNGVSIASRDASTWTYTTSGGYAGIWFVGSGNAVIDDFSGGNVVAGSTNTPLSPTATRTSTSTSTPTSTRTSTSTSTPLFTLTNTTTQTETSTFTPTTIPTNTATFTQTNTRTSTPTFTSTYTPSFTPTRTPTSAFPVSIVLDNFNRANGAVGAGWNGTTSGYSIVSNRLDVGSGGPVLWTTLYGAEQEAFMTISTLDAAGTQHALLLKSQSQTSWNGGAIGVLYNAASKWVQVWTYSSAQGWVQRGTNISVTMANGDRLGARAKANGTVEVYRNGSLIGSRDASSWTYSASTGYIGLWFSSASNSVLDDFGGGTVASVATPSRTATSAITTPTNTPTRTPTNTPGVPATQTPSPTVTRTATITPIVPTSSVSSVTFPLGLGGSDVIPHQVVRTNADHLYIFANQQGSGTLRVYRTLNPGLPNSASDFVSPVQFTEASEILSVDAIYDGGTIVHAIINTRSGQVKDYPFDTTTNTFKPAVSLATDGGTVSSVLYVGTSGVTGMVDLTGKLHVAYWTNTNHIMHRSYTYTSSTNALTPVEASFTQVDTSGNANHPSLAVSPVDNSLTIAWVSEADSPAKIRTRTRTSNGSWGSVDSASTSSVWTFHDNGINVDQGPSLIIDSAGVKHLAYIESCCVSGDYGRVHYVTNNGSAWVDTALSIFTHDPALAIDAAGQIYIIGHGHPKNTTGDALCRSADSMDSICTNKKNANGSWDGPKLFLEHPSGGSFDASPSVKWSVVGFNRPEVIEFIFFKTPYETPTLYYARLP